MKGATNDVLYTALQECLNYDNEQHTNNSTEANSNNSVLVNTGVADDRLELPAPGNNSVLHRLPDNFAQAHSVLKSTYKKTSKSAWEITTTWLYY